MDELTQETTGRLNSETVQLALRFVSRWAKFPGDVGLCQNGKVESCRLLFGTAGLQLPERVL